jgi:hypothetical protein
VSRVVIVRDARTVTGGGGCCSGDVRPFDEGGAHGHSAGPSGAAVEVRSTCRPGDDVAALYRALRQALPDEVDVQVVSPSNWLWLLPALVADGRRRGLRGAALRRSVRAGMAVSSLVVDGEVLFSGWLPDPASGVAVVRAELGRR